MIKYTKHALENHTNKETIKKYNNIYVDYLLKDIKSK